MSLSTVSNHIALYLGKNLASDHDTVEIYAYGLEILLGAVLKFFTIASLAWVLNSLDTTLIVLFSYAAIRWHGGGAHLNTYLKCMLMGTFIIVSLGLLSKLDIDMQLLIKLVEITIVLSMFVCFRWAPGDTEKKPIREKKVRLLQKIKMAAVVVVWSIITYYLIQQNLNTYVSAMILGCLGSLLFITPLGYGIFRFMEKYIWKGGEV